MRSFSKLLSRSVRSVSTIQIHIIDWTSLCSHSPWNCAINQSYMLILFNKSFMSSLTTWIRNLNIPWIQFTYGVSFIKSRIWQTHWNSKTILDILFNTKPWLNKYETLFHIDKHRENTIDSFATVSNTQSKPSNMFNFYWT